MRFTDRVTVGATKQTAEGYLVATARVARTGVQEYLASELGDIATSAGFKPSDVVRVYRHEDQVFADSTLNSITRVPVTLDHPAENVTADNWAQYSKGEVGDAYAKDGEWIVVSPMIKDAAAIEAARTTHKEISMGYEAEIVVARDGLAADFEMRNIKMNHLALVPAGRAGPQARIGDSWGVAPVEDHQPGIPPKTEKGGRMSDQLKTIVLGDAAVQVAATDVAAVERYKAASDKVFADAEAKHKQAIEAKDEEIGTLKADLKKAQDAAVIDVDALVAARSELVGLVKAIDDSIDTKGKSDAELRKAAVTKKYGDAMVKDSSDAEISGMFKALAKDIDTTNPVRDAIKTGDNVASIDDSRNAYLDRLTRRNKKEG